MIKISIVVPIYNVEKYLCRCIDSIINQTIKDIEVILVDDGSTDSCPKICDQYAQKDIRIRVIHKSNGGLSSARNEGIKVAQGQYIGFVDSDDYVNINMYEKLYNQAIEKGADIVQCHFKKVYEDEDYSRLINECDVDELSNNEALLRLVKMGELHVQSVVAWNKIYKKELFQNISYPIGKLHEDEFTTYKLFANSSKIVDISQELYYYRQVEGSIMNRKFNVKRLDYLEALVNMVNFFKNKNDDELFRLLIQRSIDTCRMYYYEAYDKIGDKSTCNGIKQKYNFMFKYYLCNKNIKIEKKLSSCIFYISQNIYKLIQTKRKKQLY